MNKLEKLIASLCPRGVEYKTLGEVTTDFYRGNGILRTQITDAGIPCVRYGEIYTSYNTWFDTCISHTRIEYIPSPKYFEHGDVLFSITGEKISEIGKSTVYVGHDKCLAGGDIVVMKHNQNPKYMGYALSTNEAQQQKSKGKVKSKVVHLSVAELMAVVIPVPPLPVQEEIVRMLDEMAGLIDELEQELAARKRQYEWCRDKALRMPKGVEYKALGEACVILDSKRKPVSKGARVAGCYPYYGANGVQDYVDGFLFDGEFLLVGEDGSVINKDKSPVLTWATGKIWVNNHAHVLAEGSDVLLRYLYYAMQGLDVSGVVRGTPPKLNQENLRNLLVPVPSRSVQEEIVRMLDEMTGLIGELEQEIVLRKQQYEYYRDRLLTFQRVG